MRYGRYVVDFHYVPIPISAVRDVVAGIYGALLVCLRRHVGQWDVTGCCGGTAIYGS